MRSVHRGGLDRTLTLDVVVVTDVGLDAFRCPNPQPRISGVSVAFAPDGWRPS